MNSGAKAMRGAGRLTVAVLMAAIGAFALLAQGCSDHGPTNLYSNPLFGQNQSGANMQLAYVQEYALSTTAVGYPNGLGPDQYVIKVRNAGSGGVMGPITAQVTMVPSCSGTVMQSYAGAQTSSQTVVFGSQGQAIYSGEVLAGYASNETGPYPYSVEVAFPSSPTSCSETTNTFTVSMTDSNNDHWTGSFTGTNQ